MTSATPRASSSSTRCACACWAAARGCEGAGGNRDFQLNKRSEEHTSELQSLMRISYAVFCLKKKKYKNRQLSTRRVSTEIPHNATEHINMHPQHTLRRVTT